MAVVIENGISASSPNDLLKKLKIFIEANGWVIDKFADNGPGKVLHAHSSNEASFHINLKSYNGDTFTTEEKTMLDLTNSLVYGIGIYGSTGFDNTKTWDKQPGYSGYNTVGSCGIVPPLEIDPVTGLEIPASTCLCGIPLHASKIGKYTFIASQSPLFVYVFVEAIEGSGIYQYIKLGGLIKVGSWDGGYFINASRSKYEMFTKTDDCLDFSAFESYNDRPFKQSTYANLFVYGKIDATVGWMSNAANQADEKACGTGRKCSGILSPGTSKLPSYEFLLSSGKLTAIPNTSPEVKVMDVYNDGALCNEFNSTSILFPFYVYAIRDPLIWNRLSVVGYPPNSYLCNMKYLAEGGTYELDHSGQHFMTFPISKKGYKFGYDGFAIKID